MFRVVSCTSEAVGHPASNLTTTSENAVWQTDGPQKKAVVVIEFVGGPIQIHRISFGNAGSAFVEILVGRKNMDPEDYVVLLPITSCMTFTESKAGSKEARVRAFSFSVRDRLKQNVADEEWERMRIVCTHPFCNVSPTSTSLPIGLSNLRINSELPPSDDKRTQASTSSTSTSIPVSNAATSSLTSKNKTSQPSTPSLEREKEKEKETKHEEEEIPRIPYHKILSGVTFVISGMVNPERTNLRDQATSMGARYQPEWSNKATHLICPFPNTPKYKEVEKKGGTIVVPAWIEDCHAQKRRLPVDTYVLGDKPPTSMYEEEESTPYAGKSHEGTITNKSTANNSSSSSDTEDMSEPQFGPSSVPKPPIQTTPAKEDSSSDTEEMPEVDVISLTSTTNAIKEPQEQEQDDRHKSDDEDTNEMELVDENLLVDTQEIDAEPVNDDDRFLQDTQELEYSDEESEITDERKGKEYAINALPNFMENVLVFFFGKALSEEAKKKAARYIVAYGGIIHDYFYDTITHIVVANNQPWEKEFDTALSRNSSLRIVTTDWIEDCRHQQKLVPTKPFLLPKRRT